VKIRATAEQNLLEELHLKSKSEVLLSSLLNSLIVK